MSKYPVGTRVFFYKPPSKQEADNKGRRAKHIDHYVCSTSQSDEAHWHQISTLEMEEGNGRNITYKRDIGMLLLKNPRMGDVDPTILQRAVIGTQTHADTNTPMQVGEHIIIKDGPLATTWYCAEISRIERQWIEVNYYTTVTPALGNYDVAGKQRRISRLKEATFLRTWVLRNSGGFPTTGPRLQRTIEIEWNGYGEEEYRLNTSTTT
jgi:hypothetical protein